jgi:hypothetical protein
MRRTSRHDDTATSLVLFGDRCDSSGFEAIDGPIFFIGSDGSACSEVLNLAIPLGVYLI